MTIEFETVNSFTVARYCMLCGTKLVLGTIPGPGGTTIPAWVCPEGDDYFELA